MRSPSAEVGPVQAVLFDLDGALSDGAAGMLASLTEARRAVGLDVAPATTLRRFIGPPLEEAFGEQLGLDAAGCARALAAYRRHDVEGGATFDAPAYSGAAALLAPLRGRGLPPAVATSKPAVCARRVVEHLRLDHLLAEVVGAEGPPPPGAPHVRAAPTGAGGAHPS